MVLMGGQKITILILLLLFSLRSRFVEVPENRSRTGG